jgi:hypothetical protein
LNRFDHETKTSFLDLYTKVDADVDLNAYNDPVTAANNADPYADDIPF